MWYCSLCDRSLGEISSDSNHNHQPTCPYCHGAVEEECKPMDSVTIGNKLDVQEVVKIAGIRNDLSDVLSNGSHIEFSDLAAESVVEHIFDMVGRSLDESEYYEFSEDILHIIRSAFEPRAKMAYGEITKIVTARFTSVDAGLVDPEESFEDDGVLLAKALTDVAMAIGDLNERMVKIENTVSSIEKQVMLPNQKMRKKETQWQEM